MKEYLVPTGDGEAQFIERRSRFIGHIFLTETEEEALARLKQMREQYWDATHNVYAYIIRDGATRFSDDGEPGGTAGMPVLQVLQREEIYNVTCVVTRLCSRSQDRRGCRRALHQAHLDECLSAVPLQLV